MCQPKDKGGRRCPTHQPASIGLKKFMVEEYGLLPSQVEHTFKALRNQAPNAPLPSTEEYQHLVNRSLTKLERAPRVTDKGRRSIERQLNKDLSESELPDGATFYALKKLQARSREQKREFVQMIRQIAEHRGTNRNEALRAFTEAYENEEGKPEHDFDQDFDSRTLAVYNSMMSREGTASSGVPEFSTEPRITRAPLPNGSTWVTGVGYDPDDGRLEVETNGNVYAYHNVPEAVWNEIQTRPDAPSYISRNILRNRDYAYESEEARTRDAVGRYCEDCHKYRAISGHVCDAPGARRERAQEEENKAIIETALAEEESLTKEQKASYEEALERIRKNLEDPTPEPEPEGEVAAEEAPEEAPAPRRRQRRGPTARQRRWTVPVEDREVTNLNTADYALLNSGGYAPKIASIKRTVMSQGGVAEFDLKYPRQYTRRADGSGYEYVSTSATVKAYADGEDGDIKFETSNLQCTCEAYGRNYTCEHVNGGNSRLERSINEIHRKVNPQSHLRANAGDEPPMFRRASTRASNAYGSSFAVEGDDSDYRVTTSGNYSQTEWREIRSAVDSGQPVRISMDVQSRRVGGYSWNGAPHQGDLTATIDRDEDGNYVVRDTVVRCFRCGRNEETCGHTQNFENFVQEGLTGDLSRGYPGYDGSRSAHSNERAQVDYSNLDTSSRLTALNESISNEWMSNPDDVQEMESTFGSVGNDGYTKNLDGYIEDVRAAEARINDGGDVVPFSTEPVTNGVCSPESGRGFGIEIEFDLPRGVSPSTVGAAIAEELHSEGLSDINRQTRYHGYSGNQWHIEEDCTVSGEVVSPILHDTPEHWEQVQKVCDIIKRHGGKATANTGGHVHMGLGRGSSAEVARRKASVTQIYTAYEDSIRRVQTDPKRKKHRDSQWCSPMDAHSAQRGIYQARNHQRSYPDHHTSLNLGHEGRVEFRGADGSLDPGHIQAQVMMSAGIVAAAERGETPGDGIRHSKIGSNAKKIKAIRGENEVTTAKTDDELIVTDAEFRKFTDLVMPSSHGRKATAGIAANTPWQESRYVAA